MADSRAAAMPPDSVGRLAVASVATGFAEEPLAEVKRRLSGARHEALDLVVVLDADGLYAGATVMNLLDRLGLREAACASPG